MFHLSHNKLNFQTVQPNIISNLLKSCNVNKAAGIENISGRFLKDGADVLDIPITRICNLSIRLSQFPKDCKVVNFKTDPKNFRPISLLPIVSKIFEKAIHEQTMEHLTDNNILYKYQSGFRENHSSDTSLSHLTNKIMTGFDSVLLTGMILIDLQKLFDTINYDILLKKIASLGSPNHSIKWFQSYLSDRIFRVSIKSKYSSTAKIEYGEPKGSILAPLLFLLYVNDIQHAVDCDLFLYADDSCLVYYIKDVSKIEQNLNKNFSNICDWLVDNKLSIHFGEDKTKCILFCTKQKLNKTGSLNIKHGTIQIKQYHTVTYLDCVRDENLSRETMALKVISKN